MNPVGVQSEAKRRKASFIDFWHKNKCTISILGVTCAFSLGLSILGLFYSEQLPTFLSGAVGCLSTIVVGVIALVQDWKIYKLSRMDQRKADVILEKCDHNNESYTASNVSHRRCGVVGSVDGNYLHLWLYNYLDNPVIDIKARSYTVNGKHYCYTDIEEIKPDDKVKTLYKNAHIVLSCWIPKGTNTIELEIAFSNLFGDTFSKRISVLRKDDNWHFTQDYCVFD